MSRQIFKKHVCNRNGYIFIAFLVTLNFYQPIISMQKLQELTQKQDLKKSLNLNPEQKKLLREKIDEDTEDLKIKLNTHKEKQEELCQFKKQILANAIYYNIEAWFTPENINLVKDVINEQIITFKPFGLMAINIDNCQISDKSQSQYFGTPLLKAIKLKRENIAIKLISNAHVNINQRSIYTNETALHCAISIYSVSLVLFLIKQDANLNIKNNKLKEPLTYAKDILNNKDNLLEQEINNLEQIIKLLIAKRDMLNSGKNILSLEEYS